MVIFTKLQTKDIEQNNGQVAGLPKNPRLWGKDELEVLKTSLVDTPELFEARGILCVPHKGRYVAIGGNMRLAASKELKMQEVPCVVFPEDTPVEKLKEIAIKDNGAFGEWDYSQLAEEWDDLPLGEWGVPQWEQDDDHKVGGADVNEDDFDENEDDIKQRCIKGDIWLLGEHRLMCGDSTNPDDIAKLMNGEVADMWLTDPPYNVDYAGKEQRRIDSGYGVTKHKVAIANDKMDDSNFLKFLTDAFDAAKQFLKPGGVFYIWHSDSEGYNFRKALRDIKKMKVSETLIWIKNSMCLGRNDYQYQHEPCLYGWKEGAGHLWYSDRKQTTILEFQKPRKADLHPTMKPVELFAYQMINSTKANDIVLDTFGGSGTTIIAAQQLNRRARLMELEPHYCDVIIARWEKLTGMEAVRVE